MREIGKLNKELEKLQQVPYSMEVKEEESRLKKELEDLLDREEALWKQGPRLSGWQKGIGIRNSSMPRLQKDRLRIISRV